jgi:hypothetical protein
MENQPGGEYAERSADALISWTKVIYALHAFSLATGILGAATIVGAFLTGWPSIIASFSIMSNEVRSAALGSNRTFVGRFGRSGSVCCGFYSAWPLSF